MEKILLGGYFGFENIGDDAILLSEINFLKKEGFTPIILTNKGKKIFNEESINRYNFLRIINKRKEFKNFILGGGGILQDSTSFRSLIYYLFLINFMKILRKKVILLNIGIGPIKREISKKLLFRSLKKCDLIIFRDKYSFYFYPDLNFKYLSSDSSFILNFQKKEREDLILISLRNFNKLDLDKFKKFIDKLKEKIDLKFEFIVFSKEEIELAKILNLNYFFSLNPIDIIEKIGTSKYLIGTRYHSIIFSILTETPFTGLIYDIKVKNLIDEINIKNYILPEDNIENWIEVFNNNFEKRLEVSRLLSEKKEEFISRVILGYEISGKFLKNGSI
ncbi:MAG: polysaccharide pyruvyl transferase family protein [Caldisericia bacterium]